MRRMLLMIPMLVCVGAASADVIDFEFDQASAAIVHGQIIDTEFSGVTISASNVGGGPDLAVAFASNLSGTRDPDLQYPWDGGNLQGTPLGNVLIIAENNTDGNNDGILDLPDDEGSRPAGSIFFEFDDDLRSIGFDLVDVEGPSEFGSSAGYVATFFQNTTEIGRVGFGAFVDSTPGNQFYDPTVEFGNNFANRISPIDVIDLGWGTGFNRVEFNFGGSAAIDNIRIARVPVPGAVLLGGMGLSAASFVLRRRKELR